MSINSLGYLGINSTDLNQWRQFACQVMGLEDTSTRLQADDSTAYFKMDENPYRLLVQAADSDGLAFCGWECHSEANFTDTIARLRDAGVSVTEHSNAEAQQRRVQALASCQDPSGNQHELYWGVVSDFKPLNSPVGVPRFITGDMGLGHVVLPAVNFDETTRFFTELLGFGLSDLMKIKFTDDPNEPVKRLWFMHCNSRHHSLALFEMAMPAGCVHMMAEVENIDEVGRCNDRRIEHDVLLSGTLGRHANDHMVSFYMRSPAGFDVEYGAEGRSIDDWSKYEIFESTVASFWGHDFSVGQMG